MSSTNANNCYPNRTKRTCTQCQQVTDQTATSYRYSDSNEPKVPAVQIKHIEWLCNWCGTIQDEAKEIPVPTDRTKLIRRLLSLSDDYDVVGIHLTSEPNVISVRIRLPDFDLGELRAIQWKQCETGFITADELMRVQKAGYKQPTAIPPKQPRNVATLRKMQRQRAFTGECRPILPR